MTRRRSARPQRGASMVWRRLACTRDAPARPLRRVLNLVLARRREARARARALGRVEAALEPEAVDVVCDGLEALRELGGVGDLVAVRVARGVHPAVLREVGGYAIRATSWRRETGGRRRAGVGGGPEAGWLRGTYVAVHIQIPDLAEAAVDDRLGGVVQDGRVDGAVVKVPSAAARELGACAR